MEEADGNSMLHCYRTLLKKLGDHHVCFIENLDPAFQGAGQKTGIEVWRIENFNPVPIPKSAFGKFFSGDSYVILKTSALRTGALHHDIHYWLGKDTSQDESGTAAIKAVELDAALGGRAVQYRELQGHETEKFLSYFKPCIIPQEGGVASGFKHVEATEYQTRLYVCRGKHVVLVKEVPFARLSLSHDDIFILDTQSKIFQFNGSNSSMQERAKALEVVQYIKDTYHKGKCEIAAVEDGRLMADADTGEFWGFFGGFAPLPRKTATEEPESTDVLPYKLFRVEKGEAIAIDAATLTKELIDTYRCYILDCGAEFFIWMGRSTSLDQRKAAISVADGMLHKLDRCKCRTTHIIEGFETVEFRSKFDTWPQSTNSVCEDGRGKVAALLKRQGINAKGFLKSESAKEETPLHIDCTGNLQVWRVDGQDKTLLTGSDQLKFYTGDSYIFQYSYPGEEKDENLIGTWFGKRSAEEDKLSATSQASKMVESLKFTATQVRLYEGNEPIQFFSIFQSFIMFKGGLSKNYKNYIAENALPDDTYAVDVLALFRVQGSGPENMQAIQVEPVASSLNSSYVYILHHGQSVFIWSGSLTTSESQELSERLLDHIKPNMQPKLLKEGAESEHFWELLGGKSEYPSQKIARVAENDPRLFCCTLVKGDLKVTEVHNFDQDDLMTEDIFIVNCHSDIYLWVGKQVESKSKMNALSIGEKFLEREKLSTQAPMYVVMEGSEPSFFTRFFSWDSKKSAMHGNSFQRRLSILKNGVTPVLDTPKRRSPVSYSGRAASAVDKSQRSRSMSFSPDRVRVRGRSPAFNALAANFENSNSRNMSTPPPVVRKIYPKSVTPDSGILTQKSATFSAISSAFEQPPPARTFLPPRSLKAIAPDINKPNSVALSPSLAEELRPKPEIIQEDLNGNAAEDEGLTIYPYNRLTTTSSNPAPDIDVTSERHICHQKNSSRNSEWQRLFSISCPNGDRTS